MSAPPASLLTPEEYLELERQSPVKHEYYRGTMYAMAGATPKHGLIVTNLVGELRQALKKRPCFVYSTDVRLRVSPTEFLYPDVMVVCSDVYRSGAAPASLTKNCMTLQRKHGDFGMFASPTSTRMPVSTARFAGG